MITFHWYLATASIMKHDLTCKDKCVLRHNSQVKFKVSDLRDRNFPQYYRILTLVSNNFFWGGPTLSRLGKGQGVRWWHILTWFLSLHTFTYPPHMSTYPYLHLSIYLYIYIQIYRYISSGYPQCKEMCKIANEPGALKPHIGLERAAK